jgi:hypothetical protein
VVAVAALIVATAVMVISVVMVTVVMVAIVIFSLVVIIPFMEKLTGDGCDRDDYACRVGSACPGDREIV